MTTPRLVAFDLDDTLAPSKSAIDPRIGDLLVALAERVEVAIISGGQLGQFTAQVVERLPEASDDVLSRLHLMPTCGTAYYRFDGSGFAEVYAHNLTTQEKDGAMTALETQARRLGLWEAEPWGPILEDRGSQITFSALGQFAPVAAKQAWDRDNTKKQALVEAVKADLPHMRVRAGGYTSVDVSECGIDKAYAVRKLTQTLGIRADEMVFVGDRMTPTGNDYPAVEAGAIGVRVENPQDTVQLLDALLARFDTPAR